MTESLKYFKFDKNGDAMAAKLIASLKKNDDIKVTVTGDRWEIVMDRHSSAGSFASPDAPFSQRITYTFEDEDRTMSGKAMLSYDNVKWDDDLEITYRRVL